MKNKIILVGGDPNSINSEIIFKCWKKLSKQLKKNIFVISNYSLLKDQFKKLNYKIDLKKVKNINHSGDFYKLKVIDIKLEYKTPFNISKKNQQNLY